MATRIPPPVSKVRKDPQQARSRATFTAILDAAARILGERGWQGLTTNGAAELAGVSIGSLYQYFPNKLALVEAVRGRHFDEVLTVLRAGADARMTRAQRIEGLVDGMIAVHSRCPSAHRVLIEESPRGADARGTHDRFHRECQRAYEAIVRINNANTADVRIAAQVLAAALAGAVHDAALHGTLCSAGLRRALVHLASSYLAAC